VIWLNLAFSMVPGLRNLGRYGALAASAVAIGVAVFLVPYKMGVRAEAGRQALERVRLEGALVRQAETFAADLRLVEMARAYRAADLERLRNEASNAPGADRLALPSDSVRRIRRHWAR